MGCYINYDDRLPLMQIGSRNQPQSLTVSGCGNYLAHPATLNQLFGASVIKSCDASEHDSIRIRMARISPLCHFNEG
jgi:hypothetical protein